MGRAFNCIRCGAPTFRAFRARSSMCESCMLAHRKDGLRASAEVTKAINCGDLLRAREHACADCGEQARDWEHRDYLRPLDVQPTCKSCNLRRGVAFDSVYRPAGEVVRPTFVQTDRRTAA